MDWYIKAFIRSSLLWFGLGILLGLGMVIRPEWIVFRPAHAHMNVAGFITMLVFGVGYQLLPRLFGHGLLNVRLAVAHLYLANIGLAGLVAGFLVRPYAWSAGQWILALGGGTYAIGVGLWIWNLWRTFDAADRRHRARNEGAGKRLPTLGE